MHDALLAELNALEPNRFCRRAWLDWFAGLPDAELPFEAEVLAALGSNGAGSDALNTFRLTVFRSVRLEGELRVTLARLVGQKRLTPTGAGHEVDALLEMGPAMRQARHRDLRAMCAQPSLATVHSALASALRALPATLWPPGPLHHGELRPDIGKANYPVAARSLATHVAEGKLRKRLVECAAREAAIQRADMAGSSLRPAVLWVTKALAKDADPTDPQNPCTTFLAFLDEELRRLDVVNAVEKRKQAPTSPVTRAIWRGDQGGSVRIWLAELADGRYGLLYKPKSRYTWLEGDRESVLASLPDAWFGAAIAADSKNAQL